MQHGSSANTLYPVIFYCYPLAVHCCLMRQKGDGPRWEKRWGETSRNHSQFKTSRGLDQTKFQQDEFEKANLSVNQI